MNNIIQRAEKDGIVLEITMDQYAENPRKWSEPISTMLCFHGRYDLGDVVEYNENDYEGWGFLRKAIESNEEVVHILPLYLYDHSGITISTTPFSCRWDSGQIGWIWITSEDVINNYGECNEENIEKATKVLLAEVEEYDMYLRGEVYSFQLYKMVKCECCKNMEQEHIDGCSGFYGSKGLPEALKGSLPEQYHELVDLLEDLY